MPIADGAVMVFHVEVVELEDKPAVPDQLLILGAPMIAAAAQQALIPQATSFDVGYGDQGLRTHPNQA
jgi:hypothetical protein